jgi:hypothetical protein
MFGVFSPEQWELLGAWGRALGLAFYVIHSLALWAIAERTGTSDRWMAWIPFLNIFLLAKIAKFPWFLLLFGLIPGLGLPLYIGLWCLAAKRLEKPWWVGLGLLIPVVQFFIPIYLAGGEPQTVAA